jgi:hypothetical protein
VKDRRPRGRSSGGLPQRLRSFFWDQDFARLTWEADSDLIIGRILAAGDWRAVLWLRRLLGKDALRTWLQHRRGAGLSSRQLRFWELVLDLRRHEVSSWLRDPRRRVWEGRRRA